MLKSMKLKYFLQLIPLVFFLPHQNATAECCKEKTERSLSSFLPFSFFFLFILFVWGKRFHSLFFLIQMKFMYLSIPCLYIIHKLLCFLPVSMDEQHINQKKITVFFFKVKITVNNILSWYRIIPHKALLNDRKLLGCEKCQVENCQPLILNLQNFPKEKINFIANIALNKKFIYQ